MPETRTVEEEWRQVLDGSHPILRRNRHIFGLLPSSPRCKWCNAPFHGPGGRVMRIIGKRPSQLNPRFCNVCDDFARKHLGGAEIELSMLFADVRGSTTLAEKMNASEFSQLISRFYAAATEVLVQTDAVIDKLVGDQVTGFYITGFTGPQHASIAVKAAQDLLRVTGHASPSGPWVPVGVGIHTGRAFVGAVGSPSGIADVTALGDAANIAARLSSNAGPGEILISEDTCVAAGLAVDGLEQRLLNLKGRSQPVAVRVLRIGSPAAEPDSVSA